MILVTGATGNIGGEVVRQLQIAQPSKPFPVRVMVRNPAKAVAFADSGIEVVQGDFSDPQSLQSALLDVDHVFLTVPEGPAQYTLLDNFLVAARATSHPHLVMLSGAEASADSPRTISQWHWRMQEQIVASGLPHTFLQPVYIMQNVLEYVGSVRQSGKFFGPISGDVTFSMVSPQDIAAVAAVVLTQPSHEGQTYVLTGTEILSFARVAQVFQMILRREVSYVQVPREMALSQLVGRGQPAWLAEAIISMLPPSHLITSTVADLTGNPPLTLAQYLVDKFKQVQSDDIEVVL